VWAKSPVKAKTKIKVGRRSILTGRGLEMLIRRGTRCCSGAGRGKAAMNVIFGKDGSRCRGRHNRGEKMPRPSSGEYCKAPPGTALTGLYSGTTPTVVRKRKWHNGAEEQLAVLSITGNKPHPGIAASFGCPGKVGPDSTSKAPPEKEGVFWAPGFRVVVVVWWIVSRTSKRVGVIMLSSGRMCRGSGSLDRVGLNKPCAVGWGGGGGGEGGGECGPDGRRTSK